MAAEGSADAVWQLRLLGAFELSDGQQRLGKLATRAAMALLARLCLQPGNTQPREALAELLWPDVPPESGRQRLRQTLSLLKQALEPPTRAGFTVIDADRLNIRLVSGTVHCDTVAFEQAFRRGDHASARALYAGELLPGFFDGWIADERLRLEGLFDRLPLPVLTSAITSAVTSQIATPFSSPASPPATPLPTPSPAPVAPPLPAGPPRATLPAYLTRLIGADPQAARLQQEVAEHRLVTLMGPGGTGKTRLSVEVARALAASGAFEMVVFVPLAACSTRQQLLDQLLLALRLADGKAGPLATLVQALNDRRALLVLDNFEQVVDEGAEAVAELAMELPLLHLLVTSRRALALAGEREVVVAPLALPAAQASLADAALNPAVSLFLDRARAARADFHLHEGNRAAVLDLVQLLDGMPLAIELAAARVRAMAPAEMAARLRAAREGKASALDLLARAPQRGRHDTRHQSMQETIAWSWQLLSDDLRDLLAALTVFQGGFTTHAAAAVCGGSGRSAGAMALLLDELLSHSLLRAHGGESDIDGDLDHDGFGDGNSDDDNNTQALRFSLYEPIREFAQRTLPAPAAAALRRRHRAWAVAWGQAMPATPPLAAMRTELPNFIAALTSAVADGEPQAAIDIALALEPAIEHANLPSAGLDALEAALARCEDAAKRNAGRVMLGQNWFRLGRIEDGRRLVAQALAETPPTQPGVRMRALLAGVLVAPFSDERMPQSIAWIDEALQLAQAQSDAQMLASAMSLRGSYARIAERDLPRAEALQHQALALWQQQGDQLAVLLARLRMALVALRGGRYASVCEQLGPVIASARRLQSWGVLGEALHVRGAAHRMLQQWAQARVDLRESLQLRWLALDSFQSQRTLWTVIFLIPRTQPAAAQQLSAFAGAHWQQHHGQLPNHFGTAMRYARRVAQMKLGVAASAAAFAAGRGLTLAAAVALALQATAHD